MDFARQQRDPTRHLIGIAFVILVHALIIWALLTGLARKAVEVIKKPLTATIIEEVKLPPPPPPPPPKKIIEAPKVQQPVQTYVPPPDIPVPTTTEAPVITAVTPTPPAEPHVIAPPPVVEAPPPPPPRSRPCVAAGSSSSCPAKIRSTHARRSKRALPRAPSPRACRSTRRATSPRCRSSRRTRRGCSIGEVRRALALWKFKGEGEKYVGEVEVNFTLKD